MRRRGSVSTPSDPASSRAPARVGFNVEHFVERQWVGVSERSVGPQRHTQSPPQPRPQRRRAGAASGRADRRRRTRASRNAHVALLDPRAYAFNETSRLPPRRRHCGSLDQTTARRRTRPCNPSCVSRGIDQRTLSGSGPRRAAPSHQPTSNRHHREGRPPLSVERSLTWQAPVPPRPATALQSRRSLRKCRRSHGSDRQVGRSQLSWTSRSALASAAPGRSPLA